MRKFKNPLSDSMLALLDTLKASIIQEIKPVAPAAKPQIVKKVARLEVKKPQEFIPEGRYSRSSIFSSSVVYSPVNRYSARAASWPTCR